MSPQPGPTTSASAIDVQKYTGTCLISHKARSRKQKPGNNNNKSDRNACPCNCPIASGAGSPPPAVNIAWAGLPLISLATKNCNNNHNNNKIKGQKVKVVTGECDADDGRQLSNLVLHAKGIPLIRAPANNYPFQYREDASRGWHWATAVQPPLGHHWHGPVQRYSCQAITSVAADASPESSPPRISSSLSSGDGSRSSSSTSDCMSVTSEESVSGCPPIAAAASTGPMVPRVLKARKRRKKDLGKGTLVGGLVTLQPYTPLCYGFTSNNVDGDGENSCQLAGVKYPNRPSRLCACARCAPRLGERRNSTSTSVSSSGDEVFLDGKVVVLFPTPPSTPPSGSDEGDSDGKFWADEAELCPHDATGSAAGDGEADEVVASLQQLCGWDSSCTVSRDCGRFPSLNVSSPPSRPWITLAQPAKSQPTCIFTVMCYNVLCDKYATRQMYGYCPNWALSWDYRRKAILDEIRHYNADIITLQEVETDQFYNFFMPELTRDGFDGIFSPKSRAKTMSENDRKFVDGCAIFFRMSKFKLMKKHLVEFTQLAMANAEGSDDMLNRVMTKDNIGLSALLETKEGAWENGLPVDGSNVRQPLLVCTAHIHWDPEYCDVKLIQTMMLMNELRAIVEDSARSFRPGVHKSDPNCIPLILCGDFNSLPESGVIEFLSTGHISADHPDFKELGYKSCLQKLSSSERPNEYMHAFRLSRSYGNDVMPYTNYTFDFKGVIDYILFSKQYMVPLGILGPLDPEWLKEHKVVGCPHPHIPSDHFPLLVELEMLPQSQIQALSSTSNGLIVRR